MLEFKAIEAVKFGEIIAMPKLNAEARLRVQSANPTANSAEARRALASVFEEALQPAIIDFMEKNMSSEDLIVLQVYLASGERGIERLEAAGDKSIDRSIENALNKAMGGNNGQQ